MSYPDPATTDWVPIGLGASGPQGPVGPTGATGVKGDTGPAGSEARIGFRAISGYVDHVGWILIGWTLSQSHGNWGADPSRPLIPQEGWYYMCVTMHYASQYAGGGQKQVLIEQNGTDSVGSGGLIACGQQQEYAPLDDWVSCSCVRYCAANDQLRAFVYTGQSETYDQSGYWCVVRCN